MSRTPSTRSTPTRFSRCRSSSRTSPWTADLGEPLTPGLSAGVLFAQGWARVGLPDRNETNVRADYVFPFAKDNPLHGMVATLRYSWLNQDGSPTATQFRAYVNYQLPIP